MEVNASDYTIGKVLSIEYEDGRQRPIAFLLKSLNKIERNYEIYDKKILVVIKELENQRYLLKDIKLKVKVWTDYKNLEYFIKVYELNRRQAKQVLYLSRFNFTLKYILGTNIRKANRLSKRLDQKVRTENDNCDQTLIKDH